MNRNRHVLVGGSVRHSQTGWWIRAALLAVVVVSAAGAAFHWAGSNPAAKAGERQPATRPALSSSSLSLPLFFEPNQGQTDARVKFLARGPGYGLFLTPDEAVLSLQRSVKGQPSASSVIRMSLDGANSAVQVLGAEPLPGKSSYFMGNDPAKWQRGIPQFARVEYQSVYPGIDLLYYGNQRQLEYDFRVAPGADANQIALNFQGASARLDSGDLVLSSVGGDVRFHAPHIYQPSANVQPGLKDETPVQGSFRQIAGNKIGFTVGPYDHSRELVIDPVLSYSTYLGGSLAESLVKVAVDSSSNIYVAGSTTSADFPTTAGAVQSGLGGTNAQNIFIAKINPSLSSQLVYATYLGGSGTDDLAGVAVDAAFGIYVAGSTTSTDFPHTDNAFQKAATENPNAKHGFLSKLTLSGAVYTLSYSTYLAGNGVDTLTGLAIDNSQQNAFVTGTTTSTDIASGFPSTASAFQPCPFEPVQPGGLCPVTSGPPQFFASKINTGGTGTQSMLYSTYFGGDYPTTATASGGGIAVDGNGYMYFTGTTNMQHVTGPNGEAEFPIVNGYQSCLNNCKTTDATDAILVKLSPKPAAPPVFSTYLGGSLNDFGNAVAVDTASNAYVTGDTYSPDATDWNCAGGSCVLGFQTSNGGSSSNAFIAKVGNLSGTGVYPLNYFTFVGGPGPDSGQAILADATGTVHLTGSASPGFPLQDELLQQDGQNQGINGDAFVALIATSTAATTGNYITYLGGSQQDQGTGIALDLSGITYVAGSTQSGDFPIPPSPPAPPPYQPSLNGAHDAFVTKLGNNSTIAITPHTGSPTPSPVPAGTQATFTFDIKNNGPDTATNINFFALVPTTGIASTPTAKVTAGSGSCNALPPGGNTISCSIPTLSVGATASVEVDVTPSIPQTAPQITISCSASANGGPAQDCGFSESDTIVDFTISATTPAPIAAGDLATITITFGPTNSELGYNATITPSQTTSPSMVTNPSPTFNPTTVTLSGTGSGTTALNIQTVPRPVTNGSLFRRGSFYAAWLPIGGLSLIGLGLGAGRKRRRWLAGAALGLLAALILLQPACSSSSNPTPTGGGTSAGLYTITITGSAGTGASHQAVVTLQVN